MRLGEWLLLSARPVLCGYKKRPRQHRPAPARKAPHSSPRHVRCDCGQFAVTVLRVRVGSDPQYIISLPLCRDCLLLEQSSYHRE